MENYEKQDGKKYWETQGHLIEWLNFKRGKHSVRTTKNQNSFFSKRYFWSVFSLKWQEHKPIYGTDTASYPARGFYWWLVM